MQRVASWCAGIVVALVSIGCAVGDSTPQGPVVGANRRLTFELANASPLEEGRVTLSVHVKRADTATPLEGADLSLQLLMPSMGHESRPLASDAGAGLYEARDAIVDMPGAWVLRVRVLGDPLLDEAELPFDAF